MKIGELRNLMHNIEKCDIIIKDLTAVQLRGNRYEIYMGEKGTGAAGVLISDPDSVKLIHAAAVRVISERRAHLVEQLKDNIPSIEIDA